VKKAHRYLPSNMELEKEGFCPGYMNIRDDSIGFCYGDKAWEFPSIAASDLRVPNYWCIYARLSDVKKRARKLGIKPIKRSRDC